MYLSESLYNLIQNRIIQAAMPELKVLAGNPQLFASTDKNAQTVKTQATPPIVCEASECLVLESIEEIRRPDGTLPEELGYCY